MSDFQNPEAHPSNPLVSPYGGDLVDLRIATEERTAAAERAAHLPSLQLSDRAVCDLLLLATGAFSPLTGFLGREDYQRVLAESRLADGTLWPIPITLPVEPGPEIAFDREVALRDSRNHLLAILRIEEIYPWSLEQEALAVYGTTDERHPLVAEMHSWPKINISGRLQVLDLPPRHDFRDLVLEPTEARELLAQAGRPNVVAFQTRNPLHRAHETLTKSAAERVDGTLLLHPVVGLTKPGDVDHFTRVRTYKALASRYYDPDRSVLALLPLAMRLAGPREALWHALVRRNYGANHLIVGRDHASPGKDSKGNPFYGPYDAQELVGRHQEETGVAPVAFQELVYLPDEQRYEEASRVPQGRKILSLSGTQVREDYLGQGRRLPSWFTRPEVARILEDAYPPRHKQGVCLWFTGLSGSGKSTTAEVLVARLQESGRQVTLLDGDVVRTLLSRGLGFSREDRDLNIRRIGYVAAEIVRHGGTVVVAAVSPYRAARNEVRARVGQSKFVEVFVDTPLGVCESRDVKGFYARARRGELRNFTGIDDPYEAPLNPEVVLSTTDAGAEENAESLVSYLLHQGFLTDDLTADDLTADDLGADDLGVDDPAPVEASTDNLLDEAV